MRRSKQARNRWDLRSLHWGYIRGQSNSGDTLYNHVEIVHVEAIYNLLIVLFCARWLDENYLHFLTRNRNFWFGNSRLRLWNRPVAKLCLQLNTCKCVNENVTRSLLWTRCVDTTFIKILNLRIVILNIKSNIYADISQRAAQR